MATHILPALRTEPLHQNCVITTQGVETHTLQEGIVDGIYRVLVFDPSLQTPEIQSRYATFTPMHMASLALRAMGVNWETTRAVLTDTNGRTANA